MDQPRFSLRYHYAATKMLDGISKGSCPLWSLRVQKGYGQLSAALEHASIYPSVNTPFDYSPSVISIAKKVRTNFYERFYNISDVVNALRYSPITLDVEIFNSVWSDQDGVMTLPDEDDTKEELDHTVLVFGQDKNGLKIDTGWPDWGNQGRGLIPFEYLEKYFITAFGCIAFDNLMKSPVQRLLIKKKVHIKGQKYFQKIYGVPTMSLSRDLHFNMEVFTSGGILAGWIHFSINTNKVIEILELFVLPQYRLKGIGSFMFTNCQTFLNSTSVTGYISAHDLVNDREDTVRSFFLSNNYLIIPDKSKFKDCRLRIQSII